MSGEKVDDELHNDIIVIVCAVLVLKKPGEKSIGRTDNGFYCSIYKIYFYIYTYNVCMGSY